MTAVLAAVVITLLGPVAGLGALEQYYNVPNDANIQPLNIVKSASGSTYITLDAVVCSAPSANVLSCDDGSWAIANLRETTTQHLIRVGRGQHRVTNWTLQSGTIERP